MRKFAFSVPVIAFMLTLAFHSFVRTVVFYNYADGAYDSKMVWVWNAPEYYRPMTNIPLEILIMIFAMTAFLLLLAITSKPKPDTSNPVDWKKDCLCCRINNDGHYRVYDQVLGPEDFDRRSTSVRNGHVYGL